MLFENLVYNLLILESLFLKKRAQIIIPKVYINNSS